MDGDLDAGHDASVLRRNVTRRTVLRTAAHAAWVVPAIQVVSAAPAFAASGSASISVTAGITWNGTATSSTFGLRVTITVADAPATGVQVTLGFPSGWNPTSTTPGGWAVTGARMATVVYTSGAALPVGQTEFTVTLDPANRVVGRGSYVADGGGLTVTATASNAATAGPVLLDLEGAYANLVVTGTSAAWSRSGTQYALACAGTVRNRGRTATSNLRMAVAYGSLGRASGAPTQLADGWTFRSNYYERTGAELGPGASAAFAVTRTMTGGQAGTDGTVTLRPSDATLTNEVVTRATVPVAASA